MRPESRHRCTLRAQALFLKQMSHPKEFTTYPSETPVTINRILLAATLLIGQSLPAEAQWALDRNAANSRATALGVEGNMRLTVTCRAGNHAIALVLPGMPGFRTEAVEARWDDGSFERYRLPHETEYGSESESSQLTALLSKLSRHQSVRLRVDTGADEMVTDLIDLSGSSRAIGSLPCSLSDAEIRRILVRH